MAKGTAAEVGVKLVVDSNAKEKTQEIAKGFGGIAARAKAAAKSVDVSMAGNLSSLGGLAAGALTLAGAAAVAGAAGLVGFGYKAAEAFMESQKQVKELAGTLTLIDQKGNSFERLRGYAVGLHDELQELAIETGVTDQTMTAMFNDVAERGGKTVDQAKELTKQMAIAGRAFPGGAEALSEGFSTMQLGMIRAKNPVVQMIAATHTLKGNAKAVAQQLMQMSPDKQMEIANKAIEKMSAKMKNVPLTLAEMKTSIGGIMEKLFEDAGEPIVKALTPVVGHVRDLFLANREQIADVFDRVGEGLGKAIDFVIPIMDETIRAFRDNWKEIQDAFGGMNGPAMELFEYIYEHKGEFAKTIGDVVGAIIKAVAFLIKGTAAMLGAVASVAKIVGGAGANLATGGEWGKHFKEENIQEQTAKVKEAAQMGAGGGVGNSSAADQEKLRKQFVGAVDPSNAAEQAKALQDFDRIWQTAQDQHRAVIAGMADDEVAARKGNTAAFVAAWQQAESAHDAGAMQYVSHFLDGNEKVRKALADRGPEILGDGFKALIETLKGEGDKDSLRAITKGSKPDLGIGAKGNIVQNFNGAITVKQDFRDQDPDRVALVFKEGLANAGTNRLQSKMASPFGF